MIVASQIFHGIIIYKNPSVYKYCLYALKFIIPIGTQAIWSEGSSTCVLYGIIKKDTIFFPQEMSSIGDSIIHLKGTSLRGKFSLCCNIQSFPLEICLNIAFDAGSLWRTSISKINNLF